MIKITFKENIQNQINELDRTKEFYDTIYDWSFSKILNNTNENLFEKLVPNAKHFKDLCINKFKQVTKWHYYKPLITLSDNIFDDENDGALIDDILTRLDGIPISKYFYDRHWSLNICVDKTIDKCIKLIANRLTEEMYQYLGEEFFKMFERQGYAISIDKNYCNSNFHISEVNYRYEDTGCNRNFDHIKFETLVFRIDKIALIKQRFKDNKYVMDFHKKRYKL